jgi:hypothetical protein
MCDGWKKAVEMLQSDGAGLLIDQFVELLDAAEREKEVAAQETVVNLKKHLEEYAAGNLSKDDLRDLAENLNRHLRMRKDKMSVAGKACAQRLLEGIQNTILNRLI